MGLDFIVRAPIIASVFSRVGVIGSKALGHLYLKPLSMAEVVTYVEGRLMWDDAANGLAQADGTQYRHLSDRLILTVPLTASAVDVDVFQADRAYKVVAIRESHSVVGGAAAAVRPRKITDTSAPGAAAGANVKELTTANVDLTAAINTVVSPALSATASDLVLAAGNRIALDFSGTLTGLVGNLTIVLEQV